MMRAESGGKLLKSFEREMMDVHIKRYYHAKQKKLRDV